MLGIKHFMGVFMRDKLPKRRSLVNECAIVNLDSERGSGTHWVAYCKKKKDVFYYDSFGDLPPPPELIKYIGSDKKIHYNYSTYQNFNTFICGQLCLTFLHHITNTTKKSNKSYMSSSVVHPRTTAARVK